MAIQSTNNEWLSAVKYRKPHGKKGSRKCSSSVARSPLNESSFIQLFASCKNAPLHQTRVSTFFKKKLKKQKIINDGDVIIVNHSRSNGDIQTVDNSTFSGFSEASLTGEVELNEDILHQEISYDEEALFGVCGDSLYETNEKIEDICDESDTDIAAFDSASTCDYSSQLSPCVISKYRTSTVTNSSDEVKSKKQKLESYFKSVEYSDFVGGVKKTCVRKLSLNRQGNKNAYVTMLSQGDNDKENSFPSQSVDNSMSCIELPSPIIFSDLVCDDSVNTLDSESMNACIGDLLINPECLD